MLDHPDIYVAGDLASVTTDWYPVFLGLRGLGGVGWAMFGTVATTMMG